LLHYIILLLSIIEFCFFSSFVIGEIRETLQSPCSNFQKSFLFSKQESLSYRLAMLALSYI